jgi:aminotransferase
MEGLIMNTNINVNKIGISGIRKFYNKVSKVPGALSLTLGEPDFPVPDEVKKGMIEAINNDKTTYTSNAGIEELRAAISEYLASMNINFDKEEICVTIGGSEALYAAFTGILNPKDKVLIPSPAYPAYSNITTLLDATPITCELNDDLTINIENLKKVIEEQKPKALVLSFPCNPTGAVLSKEDRDAIYNIVKDKDMFIVTDEIYASIYFEKEYYSIAQYDDIKNKIIFIGGFSKMFSMTGLRIGYFCCNSNLMNQIIKVHQYNVSCAPSIAQFGAYSGLKYGMDHIEKVRKAFIKRRDYMYGELKRLGFDVVLPKGAFYIFPSIKKFNMKSEEFCERLLNEAKVAIVPGNAFGEAGDNNIRISYCYSDENLEECITRIENWIKTLK